MSKELTLDELEALARRATPGPWWIDSHGHTLTSQADDFLTVVQFDHKDRESVRHKDTGNLSAWRNDNDASYIATFGPDTTLRLIARIRELEALVPKKPVFKLSTRSTMDRDIPSDETHAPRRLPSNSNYIASRFGLGMLIANHASVCDHADADKSTAVGYFYDSRKDGGVLHTLLHGNAYIVCAVCRDEILTDL